MDGGPRHLIEASGSARDAVVLLRHLGEPHDLPAARGGAVRFGDQPADGSGALDPAALGEEGVRPLGAEQSNTSLRIGARHVFKLFRRLEPGENPELEIGRFLSTTAFRAAPTLRGSMTWLSSGGPPTTLGVLQDLIENRGDGWQWTVAHLEKILSLEAAPAALLNEILALGVTTADFHAALASAVDAPGFAPEPAGSADVLAWQRAFRARGERALRLLAAGLDRLDPATRSACQALLGLRSRLDAAADLPDPGTGAFAKIRLHGDYHLGQTLKTRDGFVLIDFEGEPARPLAERRQLHCALKDVAGMLRSFDYAIETARARLPAGIARSAEPPLRETFLDGYQARAAELAGRFLPSPRARAPWISFFELEKAFYELEYELQNRPEWLGIPARGILRLLARSPP
jgi:maltose alpha-D-glucosyltransferase/alpha-amylase